MNTILAILAATTACALAHQCMTVPVATTYWHTRRWYERRAACVRRIYMLGALELALLTAATALP